MVMRLRERMFSWFDSFDITDGAGDKLFTVEGRLDWGHRFHINDANDRHIATLKQVMLTFLPKFEMYVGQDYFGCVKKEFTLFRPRFTLEANDWHIEGDWFEWDYTITDSRGRLIATVSKEIFNWTDTYSINTERDEDALQVLLIVLAIDAEKCSRD